MDSHQRAHQIPDSKWKPTPLNLRMLFSPIPDPDLKHASGFENYLLDRYLQTMLRIFALLGLIILPVLLPLNIIDGRNELGGVRGLDRLSFSNIGLSHTGRYWVHLVLAIFAIIAVCYIIQGELRDSTRFQSSLRWDGCRRTCLLLISRSEKQLSVDVVKRRFHNMYGGVHEVTINRDFSSLRTKLCERDALIRKLESAETTLIKKANQQRRISRRVEDDNDGYDNTSLPPWMKYLHQKDRLTIRLPLFPWLPAIPLIRP
jgi:calcium permeable stress-gated cation channel